jgi:hypothetical protein
VTSKVTVFEVGTGFCAVDGVAAGDWLPGTVAVAGVAAPALVPVVDVVVGVAAGDGLPGTVVSGVAAPALVVDVVVGAGDVVVVVVAVVAAD